MPLDAQRIKILLVDDDEMIRIYFRDIFWIHGLEYKYELTVADNLKKAEETINNPETRPNIIFLDLVMPIEKDGRVISSPEAGFSIIKKIKSDPNLKKIKIIVFSGHSEKSLQDQVKTLGAENYLVKGDNLPKELVEFVEKIAST
ncbi:MAG: CHEMOTAXIS PROTEIN CHEV-CheY like protein receiver-like protein [Candidatus Wolfebacteria bacterium GW2011_GWA2_42_10]|uniref:CHEMOTAXIS PROTEIN CHEV-CheY like protein receiver-like protein n=2 Tax=Candidatus Wolfeibacteriota TaxID=1752735 RepID=A0A0G1AJF9_9BACT|nr:MAG: CHEMOTAXIS PROTEIN CHEV-CheY like protein receiver-like protein [Candidatus Wolfebacteria bacterium GW2011_GWB1_41_12]KKS25433.1 MAG: CHEMOTAXIS PROTEIN CHEV-CheY like protein receiver-like protein [Candidatus Wolfebacteria bacterium GW2011_GWA2_42_10]KKT56611.1 MAG: CHEMOTAXIS PROTEIN CHEV-CheY like protein receiver-like protein [Candidatus Wolfebacteria bacterium GW2011_GWA1_44_24]